MKTITIRKEIVYPHPPEAVWEALTNPEALADWLMPNNFKAEVGHRFNFHVDGNRFYSGIVECEVLEVEPPRRLVYSWASVPRKPDIPRPDPTKLIWALTPAGDGTRLVLEHTDLQNMRWLHRRMLSWGMFLKRQMRKVVEHTAHSPDGATFTAPDTRLNRRCFKIKNVPEGYAK